MMFFLLVVTCSQPTVPIYTSMSPVQTEYIYLSVLTYTCDLGYNRTGGDATRTCDENAQWTGTEANCTCEYAKLNLSGQMGHVKRKYSLEHTQNLWIPVICARYHSCLCCPLKYSTISNDSVSKQLRSLSD